MTNHFCTSSFGLKARKEYCRFYSQIRAVRGYSNHISLSFFGLKIRWDDVNWLRIYSSPLITWYTRLTCHYVELSEEEGIDPYKHALLLNKVVHERNIAISILFSTVASTHQLGLEKTRFSKQLHIRLHRWAQEVAL